MKRTKIVFFIYEMGAGGAARTLLNIMNNLNRDEYEPMVVTLNVNGSYEHLIDSDIPLIKLPTKRLSRTVFKLAKLIRKHDVDIVFSTIHRVNAIATIAKLLSFSKAKNIVREADNLGGTWKVDITLPIYGIVYRFSDQVVSLSQGVKNNLAKKYKLKPKDIEVVYNPVDVAAIQTLAAENLPDDHYEIYETEEKVIITAGRLVEQKDHATLLRAFAAVKKELPARLVILGEGHLQAELEEQAREFGVDKSVHFIGFQHNPYNYFARADLFVLSSKHEGFSHVLAESLAAGTPVVSANCKSGPAEVLADGKYGYLCPVGDDQQMAAAMIKQLKKTDTEQQKDISAGVTRANQFRADKIVKEYEQVFQKVLTGSKGQG
ncbi:glycosyltransferase [Salisediminibacterium halotolerans]|uniref:glycosyltransferase n=1 Tax=Salisediminibacterium halotolerans TaxID=517425 RepID=UPI000EB0DE83|nr:glycosyltransferase [Salisediminibacterium halotolerans]RLJ75607.1 glycosyltransferase involved in cell wall biosynthesis [Actinophytocola xinjiangensis]RPE89461.1 glycosyltransferase involved in cell wall biosynthesis [Salisediminibacterium halotolerans]TWG36220.1 glycosyltransferase involved in cell wall biosynthesis [Salisediminibacterium halotolerans]GEL08359.1 N-acetylgalactosamine-N,N'-diacetylbacillosaminyl-diphospho-undecaprenol 4-alpha-N-acetylgalactosaminyltransferase [Salisedimini